MAFHLAAVAQCLYSDPTPPNQAGGQLYESRNGQYMPTHGMVRILVVLVEQVYTDPTLDPTPPGGTVGWPIPCPYG